MALALTPALTLSTDPGFGPDPGPDGPEPGPDPGPEPEPDSDQSAATIEGDGYTSMILARAGPVRGKKVRSKSRRTPTSTPTLTPSPLPQPGTQQEPPSERWLDEEVGAVAANLNPNPVPSPNPNPNPDPNPDPDPNPSPSPNPNQAAAVAARLEDRLDRDRVQRRRGTGGVESVRLPISAATGAARVVGAMFRVHAEADRRGGGQDMINRSTHEAGDQLAEHYRSFFLTAFETCTVLLDTLYYNYRLRRYTLYTVRETDARTTASSLACAQSCFLGRSPI